MKNFVIKICVFVFLPLLCSFGLKNEKEKLIATDNYKYYTISIYKNNSTSTPYSITVKGGKTAQKEMTVVSQDDDLFKFILIEKSSSEILYYPFAWSEASMITVEDLKTNCRKIIDKQAVPVDKKPLR